jgi:tetratricopeptide (TPR) repeat protein
MWHRTTSLWLEAAEYAPDHWLPRLALGEALHEQGRHEEAIGMFQTSLAFRPAEALTYAKLGQCQLEMGRVADATATFERLRVLDPVSTAASTGLGLIALHARDSNVARRYFLETLARDPKSVAMRQMLAQAAEDDDPQEALRLCEEIKQLAPHTPGNEECISRNRKRVEAAGGSR